MSFPKTENQNSMDDGNLGASSISSVTRRYDCTYQLRKEGVLSFACIIMN